MTGAVPYIHWWVLLLFASGRAPVYPASETTTFPSGVRYLFPASSIAYAAFSATRIAGLT